MAHPLSRYWVQPLPSEILLDDTHALMTRRTFDKLTEYSNSIPTGVYLGKMWKTAWGKSWMLRWFSYKGPDLCSISMRKILIVE